MSNKRISRAEVPEAASKGLEIALKLQGINEVVPNPVTVSVGTLFQSEQGGVRQLAFVPVILEAGKDEVIHIGGGNYVRKEDLILAIQAKYHEDIAGVLCRAVSLTSVPKLFPELILLDAPQTADSFDSTMVIVGFSRDSEAKTKIRCTDGQSIGITVMKGHVQGLKNKL